MLNTNTFPTINGLFVQVKPYYHYIVLL